MKGKYLAQEFDVAEYGAWLEGEKVVICAPTGAGKTSFVLKELLPYCHSRRKKMLILCNRRLLKVQYGFDLAESYMRYSEINMAVEVSTYQQFNEKMKEGKSIEKFIKEYDVLVFDEVHYFYADSDFNAEGTYVLLQEIIRASFFKTVVMITATLKEVQPLIEKTFQRCETRFRRESKEFPGFEKYIFKGKIYNFESWADYRRFKCFYTPDVETLASQIGNSDRKSLVFIDDRNKAEYFKKLLVSIGKVPENQIYVLNAQVLDERKCDEVIRQLSIGHKIMAKVLITTSVLDNGVSIHDEEVGNVVIATDSRISFLQMLGRIRAESVDECRLFIYPRDVSYYEKRVQQYEDKMACFRELSESSLDKQTLKILKRGWFGNDDRADFIRNAVVITSESAEYYCESPGAIYFRRGDVVLSVNAFSMEKTGNMLLAEKRFLKLALSGTENVAKEQITWIGKSPDELNIIESEYKTELVNRLVCELLKIQNYSLEELGSVKKKLAEEFRKDLFGDIVSKKGSFSTEKLKKICHKYGLNLRTEVGSDKKMRYSVVKEDE